MALINENPINRFDKSQTLEKSFIRITSYRGVDEYENQTNFLIQYNFYTSKEQWIIDRRLNAVKVEGVGNENSATIRYARAEHGVDILLHLYNELCKILLSKFPDWDAEKFSFDMVTPKEVEPIE